MAQWPALSPDGGTLAFTWRGDIWLVSSEGGKARRLTSHEAQDFGGVFSEDGNQLAFNSERTGNQQIFVIERSGINLRQVTYHSEGAIAVDWFPDSPSLLALGVRDHFWRRGERFFRVHTQQRIANELLFDGYSCEGSLSPDGTKLLFVREGMTSWRKGYQGSRAGQLWQFDITNGTFLRVFEDEQGYEAGSPIWLRDGSGFYFVRGHRDGSNLWRYQFEGGTSEQITHFEADLVTNPCLSRDGSVIVFGHLFDLYRLQPGTGEDPQRLTITCSDEDLPDSMVRRTLSSASEVSFTDDGLEIAFIAGDDLWVMDTVLREPRQVTHTVEREHSPVFAPDGESILYVSEVEGQSDIWRAERADADQYWWQNEHVRLTRVTQDSAVESDLRFSPTGEVLAYIRGRGDLSFIQPDGKEQRRLLKSWDFPDFDFSPDGRWIAYTVADVEFNRDVWIMPVDGEQSPVNVSRHPDNEFSPRFSPDGKMLAFSGRRVGDEIDVHFVYLAKEEDQTDARDRKIDEAIKKLQEARKEKSVDEPGEADAKQSGLDQSEAVSPAQHDSEEQGETDDTMQDEAASRELPVVKIDFEGIHERIRRVSIPSSSERRLFWSHDSKKLAFEATVDGKRGLYTIEPPDDLEPKLLTEDVGIGGRWLEKGNQIVWLAGGVPASVTADGKATAYGFNARQEFERQARFRAAFELAWRVMRDNWYDGALNNRNWDAVRRKYADMAATAVDGQSLARVVNLMLGELNGSHLGFSARSERDDGGQPSWNHTTAHLGLRFVRDYLGPGWKVRDVLPGGPTDEVQSRVAPGEIVLSVDGQVVDPGMDASTVLNGPLERDIRLRVRSADDEERDVFLRPITYGRARQLLYDAWLQHNRRHVQEESENKLGYLHIRAMNMSSFYEFERELYAAGAGKDGLVIDVRENGGGSTTDHLLTALTQPVHAITVPRGGGPGYPHDRKVYASWHKPVVVLCNQNSFSNAEIFSHAIKTLGRGQLVGVPTAGGVISTGGQPILDIGFLRLPFRGWFILGTGEDMELNGAVPHHIVWPQPTEMPSGIDRQLDKAIEVLSNEVDQWRNREQPNLRKASERNVSGE